MSDATSLELRPGVNYVTTVHTRFRAPQARAEVLTPPDKNHAWAIFRIIHNPADHDAVFIVVVWRTTIRDHKQLLGGSGK